MNLLTAYRLMYLIRVTEETLLKSVISGVFPGTTHACIGQEAVSVGAMLAKREGDAVFSNHRGHGHMLASGVDLGRFVKELAGSVDGLCAGKGGSQHISDTSVGFMGSNGITGGQVPIAVGYGLSLKLKNKTNKSIVFLGDGAFNQGAVAEALNMASIWEIPVVFICENNQYAMSSPKSSLVSGSISERASSFGISSHIVDGMSIEPVYMAVREALNRPGPQFLECSTYRYCGHSKSDRCLYRDSEESDAWKLRDPIKHCGNKMLLEGYLEEDIALVRDEVEQEIKKAFKAAGCVI